MTSGIANRHAPIAAATPNGRRERSPPHRHEHRRAIATGRRRHATAAARHAPREAAARRQFSHQLSELRRTKQSRTEALADACATPDAVTLARLILPGEWGSTVKVIDPEKIRLHVGAPRHSARG
jgi:hypothetical protein